MNEKDHNTNKLGEDVLRWQKDLENSEEKEIVNISEYIFVNAFLPLFAGDEKLPYPVTLDMWSGIAGGSYRAVNVVNARNEVLFTVPPILDRTNVDPTKSEGLPLAHIVTTAGQYARIHPNQGLNYLNNELSKRIMDTSSQEKLINELNIWNSIFERYNRKPLAIIQDTKEKKITNNIDMSFELM